MRVWAAAVALVLLSGEAAGLGRTVRDCETIANKFRNTCVSEDGPVDLASHVGETMSCPAGPSCPGEVTGGMCSWQRKLCVSCRRSGGVTRMRVQTNGMPGSCYTSPVAPEEQDNDFEVDFNVAVTERVVPTTQDEVNDALCDIQVHSAVPEESHFELLGSGSMRTTTGIALDGIPYFNQMSADNVDPFYPAWVPPTTGDLPPVEAVDMCLGHATTYHYHLISPCVIAPGSQGDEPGPCRSGGRNPCDPVEQAMSEYPAELVVIGIAKDGHVMYGPYLSNGEEAVEAGLDVCNGAVGLAECDDSYAYFGTRTFPYLSGCFGAGGRPDFVPQCTTNGPSSYSPAKSACEWTGPEEVPAAPTSAPSTSAPTTSAPTTSAPTTAAPSTSAPSTSAPTTSAPSTSAPTTAAPSTSAPTTSAPTTAAPSTSAPTTAAPTAQPTSAPTVEPTAAPSRPNFVIFMPDDFVFLWDEAPAGTETLRVRPPTPNMDRVRAEGAVFERAYTVGPKCAPSRFALLAGRYGSRGVYARSLSQRQNRDDAAWTGRVNIDVPPTKLTDTDLTENLQTALSAEGYETIHSGKWHLFPSSLEAGYLASYETLEADIKASGFTTVASAYATNMDTDGATDGKGHTWSHNYEWMVSTSLTAVQKAVADKKSFFLHFTPTGPHNPKTKDALERDIRDTPLGKLDEAPVTTMRTRAQLWEDAEELSSASAVQETLASHMWVDDALGAVLTGLEDLDVLDNTVVVLCTDHGTAGGKGTVAELGTRTMQAVRYPAEVAAGTTIPSVVTNIDTAATFLDWGNAAAAAGFALDGESWRVEAAGGVRATTRPKAMEMLTARAVVVGNYKYTDEGSGTVPSLYDLSVDPTEGKDVSGEGSYATVLADMQRYFACHLESTSALEGGAGCTAEVIANPFASAHRGASVLSADEPTNDTVLPAESLPLFAACLVAVAVVLAAVVAALLCARRREAARMSVVKEVHADCV